MGVNMLLIDHDQTAPAFSIQLSDQLEELLKRQQQPSADALHCCSPQAHACTCTTKYSYIINDAAAAVCPRPPYSLACRPHKQCVPRNAVSERPAASAGGTMALGRKTPFNKPL